MRNSLGGTTSLGINIPGIAGTVERTTEATAYALAYGTVGIGGLTAGSSYAVNAYLKASRGSYNMRGWDNYLRVR
jgi:hypothetical protein